MFGWFIGRNKGFQPNTLPNLQLWLDANRIGVQGYSLDFDGTDDYVQANNVITAYPFTLECWVRPEGNVNQSLITISDTASTALYYSISYTGTRFQLIARNVANITTSSTNTFSTNTWYHIAGVFASATDRKLYVNAVEEASSTSTVNYSNSANNKVLLGILRTVSPTFYLNGQLSDCRIWNTARTQQEIADNYQKRLIGNESGLVGYWKLDRGTGTTVTDFTSNANTGTINGAIWDNSEPLVEAITDNTAVRVWADQSGKGYDATQSTTAARPTYIASGLNGLPVVRFDGTDDNLAIPSSTTTFKFMHSDVSTVFIVVKAGVVADPGVIYALMHNGTGTSNVGFYYRYNDLPPTSNDRLGHNIYFGVSGQVVANNQTANGTFPANQFVFFSIVSKPSDAVAAERSAISINGGTATKDNSSTNTPSTADATNNLTIGGSSSAAVPFLNGDIAEIIVYNRTLNTSELAQVHRYLARKWGIQLA